MKVMNLNTLAIAQMSWLRDNLNLDRRSDDLYQIVEQDLYVGLKAPTHVMLEVANDLYKHGWFFKVVNSRALKNATRASGVDITEQVIATLEITIRTAISEVYVLQAKKHITEIKSSGGIVSFGAVVCKRKDGKLPLRIVRDKSEVFVELHSDSEN